MKKMSETIVFFGSGPVAAAALSKLTEDFNIEAVITKPKPLHHKDPFPVIELAKNLNLEVHTLSTKGELIKLFKQKPFSSQLGLVIDFGIIIPAEVIDYFPLSIVNSHFSLLPKYRGADPISFAILNNDTTTGVSLMLIVPALDEGPLLSQKPIHISPKTTSIDLTKDLIELSHNMLTEDLPKYVNGDLKPVPQTTNDVSYSNKLSKADGILNWSKTAKSLECEVRAFIEWPRSRTSIGSVNVVVTSAHVIKGQGAPGRIYLEGNRLGFFTAKDIFIIDTLIPEGKKEMSSSAFLAGHSIKQLP